MRVEIDVVFPGNNEKLWEFDERSLEKQIEELCNLANTPYDPYAQNPLVLCKEVGKESILVTAPSQLLVLQARSRVKLTYGDTLVKEALTPPVKLHQLVSVHSEDRLAEAAIHNDAFEALYDAIRVQGATTEHLTTACACLCGLLQHKQASVTWFNNRWDDVGQGLIKCLLEILFPEISADKPLPQAHLHRSALASILCLLQECPEKVADIVTAVIESSMTGGVPIYQRIAITITDECVPAYCKSGALMFMSEYLQIVDDSMALEALKDLVDSEEMQEVVDALGNGERRTNILTTELFDALLLSCAESEGGVKATELLYRKFKSDHQSTKLKKTQEQNDILRKETKKLQAQRNKMAPFVVLPPPAGSQVLQVIQAIISTDWDQMQWNNGYTLLHFVCEKIEDPGIVELVAAFASDIEAKDNVNMRPIDYARNNPEPGVAKVMEELRNEQRGRRFSSTKSSLRSDADLTRRKSRLPMPLSMPHAEGSPLDAPEFASARHELRSAIELVLQHPETGWDDFDWKGGFSALHLAAKEGHANAIKLLIKSKARVDSKDDYMLTPIDYATKENHEEAIQVLQAALESARSEKLSETSSEKPSEKPPEQEGGPKPIYHVGDEVEVFSNSLGKWFKGRVEKVLAGTVRVMFSDDTGAPHYKELEETNQDLRVLKARTEEEAIAEAAKLGFVVGGPAEVYSNSNKAWMPAKIERLHNGMVYVGYEFHGQTYNKELPLGHRHLRLPHSHQQDAEPNKIAPPQPDTQRQSSPQDTRLQQEEQTIAGDHRHTAFRNVVKAVQFSKVVEHALHPSTKNPGEQDQAAGGGLTELEKWKLEQRDPEMLGIQQLRQLLEAEKTKREELEKILEDKNMVPKTEKSEECVPLAGPLNEDQMAVFLPQLQQHGAQELMKRLMEPSISGGADLSEKNANLAIEQLQVIQRITRPQPKGKGKGKNKGGEPSLPLPPHTEAESHEAEPNETSGKAEAEADTHHDAHEAGAPQKGKKGPKGPGKGKAKGPPLPGAVGPPAAEEPPAEPPSTEGENPPSQGPPGKGPPGKGPPGKCPPGKGPPGKGPPGKGPAGKGPPGKGPPAPAGKGPPAPAGKGPPGKGPPGKGPAAAGGGKGKAKGGKKGKVEPKRPVIKPKAPMKPLHWEPFLMGGNLHEGTIWDRVPDLQSLIPEEELVGCFAKKSNVQQNTSKDDDAEKKDKKPEKMKDIKLFNMDKRLEFEITAKSLPDINVFAQAVQEMDETVLDAKTLENLLTFYVKEKDELEQLNMMREIHVGIPVATPEQYVLALGQISAAKMRISCWSFLRRLPGEIEFNSKKVTKFERLIDSFITSKEVPFVMGLLLALGNYLNGGSRIGRADGFNLDTLTKLDMVKDTKGKKEIRHFLWNMCLQQHLERLTNLLQEMSPLSENMFRVPSDQGGIVLDKKPIVNMGDIERGVGKLQTEMSARLNEFQLNQSYIEDPSDIGKLTLRTKFEEAKLLMDKCDEDLKRTKAKFDQVLELYCFKKMSKVVTDPETGAMKEKKMDVESEDWIQLWDDFFWPSNVFDAFDNDTKKHFMAPRFCSEKPLLVEDLELFWGFKNPKQFEKERLAKLKEKRRAEAAAAGDGSPVADRKRMKQKTQKKPACFQPGKTLGKKKLAGSELED